MIKTYSNSWKILYHRCKDFKSLWLFADKNHFVYSWYIRLGFEPVEKCSEGEDHQDNWWMKKII